MSVTAIAAGLAGCNLEYSAVQSPTVLPAMSGTVMGGETPIRSAVVTLWQTTSNGYGSASAVKLATTTTATGGGFSFATGYTCTAGQYAYLTSTGGDVANNPSSPMINNNVVLMAALGSCSHFDNGTDQGKVNIAVNELSTVAAAYALGNFISVNQNSGSGAGNQLVYVGAPANNNAATGSCTGTGSSMSCVAAGLGHAFANAANLVDAVHYDGTTATGTAFTTVPGNSLGSVPQAEINALGDIMQACTNTTGGVAGDGSACGYYFTDATPSGGTAPTDTLSAMINVAQHPTTNVGSTCTGASGGLFCVVQSLGVAFQPVLSAAPTDWALGITYSGLVVSSTSTSWGSPTSTTYYPEWLALDANDNVYVLAGGSTTTNASAQSTVSAMASNGTGMWANAPSVDGNGSSTASGCYPGMIATDINGNVWNAYGPPSTSSTCKVQAIYGRSAATGGTAGNIFTSTTTQVIQGQAFGLAFDRYSNMWYARNTSSGSSLAFQLPYSAGSYGAPAVTMSGSGSPALASLLDVVTDANANVYISNYISGTAGTIYVIPNLTPTSTPSYTGGTSYLGETISSGTGTASKSGIVTLDSSGNIWAGGTGGLFSKITPTLTSGVITSLSEANLTLAGSSSSATEPYPGQMDANGTLFYPSFTSSGQIWFSLTGTSPTAPTTNDFYTCWAPGGATTCGAKGSSTNTPKMLQIDSTGSIWVPSEGTGNVIQVLGVAAPMWPQLSYGVFATKPQ